VRAFPFHSSVMEFVASHEQVFVVEQNRDGQLRQMLINEGNLDSNKVVAVLHYDGTPITARFIIAAIAERLAASNVTPIKKVAQ
jgi:2-oxoglutarate ferredoxin oxidoreductase subunit alpha